MTRPASRRALPGSGSRRPSRASVGALLSLCLALVLTVLLSGSPAGAVVALEATPTPTPSPTPTPARPARSPSADDEGGEPVPKDPLDVVIERLTPSSLPARGKVRVSGTVTNRSEDDWTDLSVYLLTSPEPMTTPAQLADAVASDPRTDIGPRIIDAGLFVDIPDLAPRQRTTFHLAVPVDRLAISGEPGVYWLGVHVLGTNDEGRLEGADGRARTFLPLVPPGNPGTDLALAVQFRNHTVRAPDGELEYLDGWQATLSHGGRLRRLLDLGTSASPTQDLTWVVDPAVLDAALSVARGNPELDLAPAKDGDTGDDAGDDQRPTPEQAATVWRDEFFSAAQRHSVLSLPYGDLDASAVMRHAVSDLLTAAFEASTQVLTGGDITSSPVLLPPSGLLSPSAVADLEPGLPLVVAPGALADDGTRALLDQPLLNRADGGRILLAPLPDALWGPGPGAPRSALAVRQKLLADAAVHALSKDRDEPLVRFLPPGWDPGRHWKRSRFFRGLDLPWLSSVDTTDVLDKLGADPAVDPGEDLAYPQAELEAELPLSTVLSTEALIAQGSTVEELVTDDSDVDEEVSRLALLTSSVWSRRRPGLAAERAVAARERVAGWLDQVTVRSPSFVTMSSGTGTFQVTVVNGLDERVTVGLRATVPGGDLELSTPEPMELAPHSRGAVRVDAASSDIGVHLVTLQPVSEEGTPLGRPTTVSIRSSRVGLILWIVMAVGGTALFLAIVLRIWRRVRRRRRTHGPLLQQADRMTDPTTSGLVGRRVDPLVERGDGRRHRGVPAQWLRPLRPAGGGLGHPAARGHLHDRQHRPQHALHPVGRRRLQRRPRASAGARHEGRLGRR